MKKVLLLNPPSLNGRSYSRDYFCSKTLKGSYVEHPVDLLFLSGLLHGRAEVEVLDATAARMSGNNALGRVRALRPDLVFFLSGTASFATDAAFMKRLRGALPDARIVGLGDVFFVPGVFEGADWMDAVLTDFTSAAVADYVETGTPFPGLFERGRQVCLPEKTSGPDSVFSLPVPRHELFVSRKYSFPFARQLPFATVLTDFGCPYGCAFCINSAIGYKVRPLENVFAELGALWDMGVRELFFRDQTFCSSRERLSELCGGLARRGWRFSWTAFARPDQIDLEFVSQVYGAGCHSLIIGTETAEDEKVKGGIGKKFGRDRVRQAFDTCRAAGIETIATVMLGLPGQGRGEIAETIDFVIGLDCDYASFNCFVPKPATAFIPGLDYAGGAVADQSGGAAVYGNGELSGPEIARLMKTAKRRFYLRPGYLLMRLAGIRSLTQFRMNLRNGLGFLLS